MSRTTVKKSVVLSCLRKHHNATMRTLLSCIEKKHPPGVLDSGRNQERIAAIIVSEYNR